MVVGVGQSGVNGKVHDFKERLNGGERNKEISCGVAG
jgi:hypothetical protein